MNNNLQENNNYNISKGEKTSEFNNNYIASSKNEKENFNDIENKNFEKKISEKKLLNVNDETDNISCINNAKEILIAEEKNENANNSKDIIKWKINSKNDSDNSNENKRKTIVKQQSKDKENKNISFEKLMNFQMEEEHEKNTLAESLFNFEKGKNEPLYYLA